MKHLSSCLTVLLLGGVPLAAAAVDYGPNSTLLAAETTAPQLPGAMRAAPGNAIPKPDMVAGDAADAGDAVQPIPQRMAPSASAPRPATPTLRSPGPTANNNPHATTTQPMQVPPTASWQSLLPGSIQ